VEPAPTLRHPSTQWIEATLARGLEDSPDVVALINEWRLNSARLPNDIEEP
jgi:hypothetical protein